jgi:hypothetical protein
MPAPRRDQPTACFRDAPAYEMILELRSSLAGQPNESSTDAFLSGDNLVPKQPGNATKPPTHSKAYKISMTLLIVLGTLGFAFAIFYWASFYH